MKPIKLTGRFNISHYGSINHFEKMVKMAISIDPSIKEITEMEIKYWCSQVSEMDAFKLLTIQEHLDVIEEIKSLHDL
jgi:hypothetical protein